MIPLDDVIPAAEALREKFSFWTPEIALILGSGFSSLSEELSESCSVDYVELPGFPATGVAGHSGKLWYGQLYGRSVLIFQGRYHYYEGYSAYQVTAQIRLAKELGCRRLLLTNAAGGIAEQLSPGDFMLITDHLNLVGESPLRGITPAPFVDLCNLYRQEFYPQLSLSLRDAEVNLQRGTLAWLSGPSYETPSEIRMLKTLGADAVSMSTIPEAIMAHTLDLDVVGISLIANAAAGISSATLSHEDVLAQGRSAALKFPTLVSQLFSSWNQ